MAVSFVTSAAWATHTADTAFTLSHTGAASGDRYFLLVAGKQQDVTVAVSGWTDDGSFADGVVASGNGTGSMRVRVFHLDHTGSNPSNPTVDYTGTPILFGVCSLVFRKGASETWDTPIFLSAAWPVQGSGQGTTSTGSVVVKDGVAILGLLALRNDEATWTRATTAIRESISSDLVFNGDYVEAPATHLSTTTGNDMAADAGYRLVTTGSAGSKQLVLTVTSVTSAESGAAAWVVQGSTAGGVTEGNEHFLGGGMYG